MLVNPEAELVCSALRRELSLTQRDIKQVNGFTQVNGNKVFLDCYTEISPNAHNTYVALTSLHGHETWGFKQKGPLYTVTLDCDINENKPTNLLLFSGDDVPVKQINTSWYGKPIMEVVLAAHARRPEKMIYARDVNPYLYPVLNNLDSSFLSWEEIIDASARLALALRELNPLSPLPMEHTYERFPELNPHYVQPINQ
jgi:hypothetical protein